MLALRSKSASPMKSSVHLQGNLKVTICIIIIRYSTGRHQRRGTSLSPRKLKFDMTKYTECIVAGKYNYKVVI